MEWIMSKINTNKEQPDLLGDLFKRIPEEELPASFRSNVMRQIMLESAKAKKRDERFSLLAAIVASLIMISLAIVSFVYMEIPKIAIPTISTSALAFYLYIGAISDFTVGLRCSSASVTKDRNGSSSWFSAGTAEWVNIMVLFGSMPAAM